MGLCKCKNATAVYCYVHRLHVCPTCILQHANCVCKTYVEWLKNPEYDWPPVCTLCKQQLGKEDILRLPCYHIFHPGCIKQMADSLPENTAPAGYACPTCSFQLLPSSSDSSPLAESVRAQLSNTAWAQRITGLTRSLASAASPLPSRAPAASNSGDEIVPATSASTPHKRPEETIVDVGEAPTRTSSTAGGSTGLSGTPGPKINLREPEAPEEDKYRRRGGGRSFIYFLQMIPFLAWLVPYFQSTQPSAAPTTICGISVRAWTFIVGGICLFIALIALGLSFRPPMDAPGGTVSVTRLP